MINFLVAVNNLLINNLKKNLASLLLLYCDLMLIPCMDPVGWDTKNVNEMDYLRFP